MKILNLRNVLGLLALSAAPMTAFCNVPPAPTGIAAGSCTDAQRARITTSHTTVIAGRTISYDATVGFVEVTSADNTAKACVFYTAYTVQPQAGHVRPITFAFNGGPGSASLWLHLGLMGPMRVDLGHDGLGGSGNLIRNEYSPLDVTDIVMIDPVATGFSFAEGQAANDPFFGVKNDYKSIASFIQGYLDNFNRWESPKFILGESYGGVRGSLLANHLQGDLGIKIDGLILISPAISDLTFDFSSPDANVAYWTFFPSFVTTAWFHRKVADTLQAMNVDAVWNQAQSFAENQLRNALDQGTSLDNSTYQTVAQMIADFTGLSRQVVAAKNLRVSDEDMFTGLLAAENQDIGRYDSRYTAAHIPVSGRRNWNDPSDTATSFVFTAGINEYLRVNLGYTQASPYNTSADIQNWPDQSDDDMPINVIGDMAQALSYNPKLKVYIASGYFDLACPIGTVAYELTQMPDGAQLKDRVTQKRFFGGHMMYINPQALAALKGDLASFINAQSAP